MHSLTGSLTLLFILFVSRMNRVVSSAYANLFISLLYLVVIPLISLLSVNMFSSGTDDITNSNIDRGQPCLTDLSIFIVWFGLVWVHVTEVIFGNNNS